MTRERTTLVICLSIGVALGVGQPLGELWLECSRGQVDACGWDRVLLPVTLSIGVVVGLAVGAFLNAAVRTWQGRRSS